MLRKTADRHSWKFIYNSIYTTFYNMIWTQRKRALNLGPMIGSTLLSSPLLSPRHHQQSTGCQLNAASTLSAPERRILEACYTSWSLGTLPDVVKPYAELICIHKPAGIMKFYFPCLCGTFLVGCLGHRFSLFSMGTAHAELLLLGFLLRGMLCTWNAFLDRPRHRPPGLPHANPAPRPRRHLQQHML